MYLQPSIFFYYIDAVSLCVCVYLSGPPPPTLFRHDHLTATKIDTHAD